MYHKASAGRSAFGRRGEKWVSPFLALSIGNMKNGQERGFGQASIRSTKLHDPLKSETLPQRGDRPIHRASDRELDRAR